MKRFFLSLIIGAALAAPAFAQTKTNQPTVLEQVKATTQQTVATNLNEVIIDILRGVHTAGGEIYQASKTAITKSVDFTMEQAPLVVKEFLTWKAVQASIWIAVWGTVALCLFYAGRCFKKAQQSDKLPDSDYYHFDKSNAGLLKWLCRGAATATLIITLGINGMIIAKIAVAPRVYLIEYVVDAIQGHNQSR